VEKVILLINMNFIYFNCSTKDDFIVNRVKFLLIKEIKATTV